MPPISVDATTSSSTPQSPNPSFPHPHTQLAPICFRNTFPLQLLISPLAAITLARIPPHLRSFTTVASELASLSLISSLPTHCLHGMRLSESKLDHISALLKTVPWLCPHLYVTADCVPAWLRSTCPEGSGFRPRLQPSLALAHFAPATRAPLCVPIALSHTCRSESVDLCA